MDPEQKSKMMADPNSRSSPCFWCFLKSSSKSCGFKLFFARTEESCHFSVRKCPGSVPEVSRKCPGSVPEMFRNLQSHQMSESSFPQFLLNFKPKLTTPTKFLIIHENFNVVQWIDVCGSPTVAIGGLMSKRPVSTIALVNSVEHRNWLNQYVEQWVIEQFATQGSSFHLPEHENTIRRLWLELFLEPADDDDVSVSSDDDPGEKH